MLATLALFLWIIGLYLVLRYRMHFHVTYKTDRVPHRSSGRPTVSSGGKIVDNISVSQPSRTGRSETDTQDNAQQLMAALISLGCAKIKARQIALKVSESGEDFDSMLRAAIREAA